MTGIWVVSYVLLWVLVVALCGIVIGALRQIGLLRLTLRPQDEPTGMEAPTAEGQGPRIGSLLPVHELDTINGAGRVELSPLEGGTPTLVAFLSPLCEGCQEAVTALNELATDAERRVHIVAILLGERRAWQSFLKVFPLSVPVVGDTSRDLSNEFSVDAVPFGLLYNERGRLVRKAILREANLNLAFLLGESAPSGGSDVFPEASASAAPAGV